MPVHALFTVILAGFSCGGAASTANTRGSRVKGSGAGKQQSLLVHKPEVDQHLVICNAYAAPYPLSIVRVGVNEELTRDGPLSYKQCREFLLDLKEGDQLDFKAGDLDVGTFYATGLPKSSASLLLIPHRRDSSKSVSFESHAFTDLASPQIAVIDAYRGDKKSAMKIIEGPTGEGETGNTAQRVEEDLRYNSVVAVNPGKYEIKLSAIGGTDESVMPLLAQSNAKYVVMRTGGETNNKTGYSYPQELIVFPNGASPMAPLSMAFAMLLGLAVLM